MTTSVTAKDATRAFLANLKPMVRTEQVSRDAILLYGPPNVGKTSLAAQFDPLFVIDGTDNGYTDLVRNGQLPEHLEPVVANDWKTLRSITDTLLDMVRTTPRAEWPFKSVAFENLGGFAAHLRDFVIEKYRKRPEKGCADDYDTALLRFNAWNGQGNKDGLPEWKQWVADVVELGVHGLRVLVLGHSASGKSTSAEQVAAHEKVVLDIHPYLANEVVKLFGNIGYITTKPLVLVEGGGTKKAKVAEKAESRVLKMVFSPQYEAKNRYGIKADIDMGDSPEEAFANLAQAFGYAPAPASDGESN